MPLRAIPPLTALLAFEFGKKLVAPFDVPARHTETIYLVSRTEQARDRRIGALRRWIIDAVGRIT